MDWNLPHLTEEHKSLVMLMKEFCEREVDVKALNELADKPIPRDATWDSLRSRVPWDLISKAHDAGLRQMTVPTQYGGGFLKMMINRFVEIALDVYGGMGPQKELNLEHWIRVHLSLMHGGSTGTLNLVKAAKLLARG
jgi:alkylation response protein AidB-like acyl-CoA dehydrogenase